MPKRTVTVLGALLWARLHAAVAAGAVTDGAGNRRRSSPEARAADKAVGGKQGSTYPALSREQEMELLNWLEKRRPRKYEGLTGLRDKDLQGYRRQLRYWWTRLLKLKGKPDKVQDAYLGLWEIYLKRWQLARKYAGAADKNEKAKLHAELLKLETRYFTYNLIVREYRLQELEKRLAELRGKLEAQRNTKGKQRQALILKSLEELLERMKPRKKGAARGRTTTRPAK